ncbi:MAG: nucleotidyltransferase domain-containing protein [Candidatus Hydrothermarchaeales archaeon]
MNDILRVFTKNNIKILDQISSETLHIREIAEKTNTSPATVHKAIELFKKLDFIVEKKVKNRKNVSLNRKNVVLKKIRTLINTNKILTSKAYKKLKKTGTIGVYGSFASGEDTPESDIDIWIYSKKKIDQIKLKSTTRKLTNELGKEVRPLTLTDEKIKELKEKDPEFYYRLKLTSVVLNGDIFD